MRPTSISVIVINYNNAPFITSALDSVLQQDYPSLEIIFCDDASTDESVQIASSYPFPIRIVSHDYNIGPLRNCLSGIRVAKNELLFFLDSDDIWQPGKVHSVVDIFNRNKEVGLVSHSHVHVDSHNNPLPIRDATHRNIARLLSRCGSIKQRSSAFRHSIIYRKGGFWLGSAYAFRRELLCLKTLTSHIDLISSSRYAYPDLVLAPYILACHPNAIVGFIDSPFLRYRRHSSSSSSASHSPAQKIANLKKLACTNDCTLSLLLCLDLTSSFRLSLERRYQVLSTEYDYLIELYSGHLFKSFILFILLLNFFVSERSFLKELVRFLTVAVFGSRSLLNLQYDFARRRGTTT